MVMAISWASVQRAMLSHRPRPIQDCSEKPEPSRYFPRDCNSGIRQTLAAVHQVGNHLVIVRIKGLGDFLPPGPLGEASNSRICGGSHFLSMFLQIGVPGPKRLHVVFLRIPGG